MKPSGMSVPGTRTHAELAQLRSMRAREADRRARLPAACAPVGVVLPYSGMDRLRDDARDSGVHAPVRVYEADPDPMDPIADPGGPACYVCENYLRPGHPRWGDVEVLSCGHAYHRGCLSTLQRRTDPRSRTLEWICPVCATRLTDAEAVEVGLAPPPLTDADIPADQRPAIDALARAAIAGDWPAFSAVLRANGRRIGMRPTWRPSDPTLPLALAAFRPSVVVQVIAGVHGRMLDSLAAGGWLARDWQHRLHAPGGDPNARLALAAIAVHAARNAGENPPTLERLLSHHGDPDERIDWGAVAESEEDAFVAAFRRNRPRELRLDAVGGPAVPSLALAHLNAWTLAAYYGRRDMLATMLDECVRAHVVAELEAAPAGPPTDLVALTVAWGPGARPGAAPGTDALNVLHAAVLGGSAGTVQFLLQQLREHAELRAPHPAHPDAHAARRAALEATTTHSTLAPAAAAELGAEWTPLSMARLLAQEGRAQERRGSPMDAIAIVDLLERSYARGPGPP